VASARSHGYEGAERRGRQEGPRTSKGSRPYARNQQDPDPVTVRIGMRSGVAIVVAAHGVSVGLIGRPGRAAEPTNISRALR
jgi:hypothetical protein